MILKYILKSGVKQNLALPEQYLELVMFCYHKHISLHGSNSKNQALSISETEVTGPV